MLNIVTLVSESHKQSLYEAYMLPSVEAYLKGNCVLNPFFCEQFCPTGTFDTQGFRETMAEKLRVVIMSLEHYKNQDVPYFVYSDCDVQFFEDISVDIIHQLESSQKDILFQHDGNGEFCAGFFITKTTENCLRLFKDALSIINMFRDDQPALNHILKSSYDFTFNGGITKPKVGLLDHKYWTYGAYYGLWNGQNDFVIPEDILVHHANWTVGIENKIKLMDLVKSYNQESKTKTNELRNRG